LKGRAIIMPGLFNKCVWRLTNWLPRFIQEKMAMAKFNSLPSGDPRLDLA
jgi:hypothetical protein